MLVTLTEFYSFYHKVLHNWMTNVNIANFLWAILPVFYRERF